MSYNYTLSISTRGVVSGISINCQQLLSKFSIRSTNVLIEQLCEENLVEQVMLNYYIFIHFMFYATAGMHKKRNMFGLNI